jgi:hypothetical protein
VLITISQRPFTNQSLSISHTNIRNLLKKSQIIWSLLNKGMDLQTIRNRIAYESNARPSVKLAAQIWLGSISRSYPIALTLTLKQHIAYTSPKGSVRKRIDRNDCEKIAERFIRKLNQQVYGHAARRYGKGLKYIVVVEGERTNKNLHLHMAIGDLPIHVRLNELEKFVSQAKLHVEHIDAQHKLDTADSGWMTYITKECGRHDTDNVLWHLS